MKKNRKRHSTQIKFNAVIDSLKKGNVTETARGYNIHPNLLARWKQDFMENGPKLFEADKADVNKMYQKRIEQYEKLLGKKELEINLLKGFVDLYDPLVIK